jgi:hypothetical protein
VPLIDEQIYWYATASLPEGSHSSDDLTDVAAKYAGWHDPIPAVLDATPPEALLRHDIYHLATPRLRHEGGVLPALLTVLLLLFAPPVPGQAARLVDIQDRYDKQDDGAVDGVEQRARLLAGIC